MSFEKFKTNSFCVGGGHRSATTNIYGDTTSKGGQVLIGHCSICKKNLRQLVIQYRRKVWVTFSSFLVKRDLMPQKKMGTNFLKNPGIALEIGANVGAYLEGDILDLLTNYKINAVSIEQLKDKKLLLDFLDETRFDIKHLGNKSTRGKNLVKLINSPPITAGSQ